MERNAGAQKVLEKRINGVYKNMALTATDLPALEQALTTNSFLSGESPTSLDASIFGELAQNLPDKAAFPCVWSWFSFVNQFAESVRKSWPAPEGAGGEEDEFDLFGDDPEAEEAAKKEADARAASKPQGPVGKSNVVFDVKPQYSSVDLEALALRIKEEIVIEGLRWGEEHKKDPVAFGIFKLKIGCVIEDTVETEVIIERISDLEGTIEVDEEDDEGEPTGNKVEVEDKLVQSVDIAAFQKI